jgi:hypothetical protein
MKKKTEMTKLDVEIKARADEDVKDFHNPLLWWIIGTIVFGGLSIVLLLNNLWVGGGIFVICFFICLIGLTKTDHPKEVY